mmetsp:Transcript_23579/g.80372  ORF Transcript_23579/g.80372 Transcript_23579/m.80372 type:complete len:90 (-) Transcript_23579:268-537(-)
MVARRFEPMLQSRGIKYKVSVLSFATDNESIGQLVCANAMDLDAAAVVMASHGKGRIKEFFLGSCTTYCTKHCKVPVVVVPPTYGAQAA